MITLNFLHINPVIGYQLVRFPCKKMCSAILIEEYRDAHIIWCFGNMPRFTFILFINQFGTILNMCLKNSKELGI